MKRGSTFVMTWMLLAGVAASPASAQKGMGEPTGVARQAVKPDVVSLTGTLTAIKTGPCEKTTGRASVGTHILLKTQEGKELNVHLGPAAVVDRFVDRLTVGQKLTIKAFRTQKMPADHYVARSLAFDGRTIEFRDETLRPFWAGGNGPARNAAGPQWGAGQGRGSGWCRGRGCGRGPGWGRGAGYGRGRGWGAGPGGGFGRGRAFADEDRDGVCDNYQRWQGRK